jgi:hypothetical protein
MKTNPLKEGALTENSAGIGMVTRGMVHDCDSETSKSEGKL